MSRRRTRSRAQGGPTAATPPPAPGAAPRPEPDADDSLHQRAVALREYRMGRGPRPAGMAEPEPHAVATATGTLAVTYPVVGMTCRACEVRIARHVGRLPGVDRVTASAVRGQVTVECSAPVAGSAIVQAIARAGYEVGRTPWLAGDPRVWATAGAGVLGVAVVAVLASLTGIGDLAAVAGDLSSGGLVVALLLGLAAGVSTCMALVGGLVLGLSAAFQARQPAAAEPGSASTPRGTSGVARMRPALVFTGGRIAGYAGFGAALGAVGASVTMPPQLTAVLMITVAVVMLLLGTRLTGLSPRLAGWSPTLPMGLGRRLGLGGEAGTGGYSDGRAAALGAASFFLPCGFTQAIQIFALSTGSPLYGAALLGAFALGTAPGLLALAGLPLVVPSRAKPTLLRLVGVAVIGFAVLNASAGIRLSGITLPSLVGMVSAAPLPGTLGPDGVQRITTYQEIAGYRPGNIVIYAGYPTEWTIVSESAASCAASLWVFGLDIRARLVEGPNRFALPPLEAGTLNYTCAMGMYGGRITVVDPPPDVEASAAAATASSAAPTASPAVTAVAARATPAPSETPSPAPSEALPAAAVPTAGPATADPAVQELWTVQDESGYQPPVARIRAGVPTTWHVDSRFQYSCAAYLVVPELGIERILDAGDNVIDLPALPAGVLRYMCGMGMFTATILVE